jgi:hypothetical protein
VPDNPLPPGLPQPWPDALPWRRWLQNLRSGLSLALLRERLPESFARSFDQMLWLLLVNLLVWVGLEAWQRHDAHSWLGLDAVYGLGSYLLIATFSCALVARMNSREADTRSLLIPLLSAAPVVQVVFRLVPALLERSTPLTWLTLLAWGAGMLYLMLLSARVLHAAYGRVRLGAGLTAVLLILVTPVALDAMRLDVRRQVIARDTSNSSSESSDDETVVEPLLYGQAEQLTAAMARLDTRRREGGAVYFVGFAGDGDQGIFRREALLADRAIGRHFGEQGRSLNLINDDEDRETYPLASVTGLSQALKLLGGRIDRANDVVVLTLTSHGSTDGGLDVSNGMVPLQDLGWEDVREAFDSAGIKWRVVIVSACYSGVFVDALRSDTSMVITAADKSHSSFGCVDNRELTYFGEAFFKDALPVSDSLEHAFARAASLIKAKETAQGLRHSNPQMFVGAQMRAKLAAIEARAHPAGAAAFTAEAGGRR